MNEINAEIKIASFSSTKINQDFKHIITGLHGSMEDAQTKSCKPQGQQEQSLGKDATENMSSEPKETPALQSCDEFISKFSKRTLSHLSKTLLKTDKNSLFGSTSSDEFFAQKNEAWQGNEFPSLFVHEGYLKNHSSHSYTHQPYKGDFEMHNRRMQTSQSFQCVSSHSLANSECSVQTSSTLKSNMVASTQKFISTLPSCHDFSSVSVHQKSSNTNISSGLLSSDKFFSRHSFQYFDSVYSRQNHITYGNRPSSESLSESDEEEDEEACQKLPFCDKKPLEYSTSPDLPLSDSKESFPMIEYDMKKDKVQQTLYKIALELLATERTYVAVLHLLDQVFAFRVNQENKVHSMFPQEVVFQMFTNLKSLYKLHHDFLLPQLEERMDNWERENRIGDVMKNFAPFLKMYAEYVKNYDNAVNLINVWNQKNQRFGQIMDELHCLKECMQLTLQHHMLTPVQRVPRYRLLLEDYLKKLPDDSPDKCDTEKALELVSIAANHANDTMKKIDKFKKLLEIQEMIGCVIDLVSPSRELLKEGKIIKISARTGDHQERYIFLFNDLLLLCSHRLLPNKVVSGPCFRVRAQIEVDKLIVEEGDNLETPNTFYLQTVGRLIELYTSTPKEKAEWIEILGKAMSNLAEKKRSLKVGSPEEKVEDGSNLGMQPPQFVKQDTITHCMCCDSLFGTFSFRRKHHCHACGIVACHKCLSHKVQLPYECNKYGRVCNNCHSTIENSVSKELFPEKGKNCGSYSKQRGVLDVNPSAPSVISGYLLLKAHSRFWVRRWFALHDDFVLYSFNSHQDEMALTSMPLPGYSIGMPNKNDNAEGREHVFKLFHKNKIYYFQTADDYELTRWVTALEKASRAEYVS